MTFLVIGDVIIVIVIVLVVCALAIPAALKHLKGKGGCCGGDDSNNMLEKKELKGPIVCVKEVEVKGMSCQHCVETVTHLFNKIEGVRADVNLKTGIATLSSTHPLDDKTICGALAFSDYTIASIKEVNND